MKHHLRYLWRNLSLWLSIFVAVLSVACTGEDCGEPDRRNYSTLERIPADDDNSSSSQGR